MPEKLLIAPQELRTADPTVAQDIYGGRCMFGGINVDTGGKSPFEVAPPSVEWARRLHQFSWIRHLAVSNDALASRHAQTLTLDWIALHGRGHGEIAWEIEIAARRLIAWLSNSITIVSDAELDTYRRFMRAIGYHVRYLKNNAASAPDGMPKLTAYVALANAAVCLSGADRLLRDVWDRLDQVLNDQIFPDGGHTSRNPDIIADCLSLLLPLRQCCLSVDRAPPPALVSAIDRLMPALRYFRMGDGALARFNGSGNAERDLVATLLRYDEHLGAPLLDASQSGYQRMVEGASLVLMDVGNPPPGELSVGAHAGCLSFEFSSGNELVVVNCGTPLQTAKFDRSIWRSTAAHSTAVLNDTSSCKFDRSGPLGKYLGGQIYSGQLKAESSRSDSEGFSEITGSHRGYVRDFGIRHERRLRLDSGGDRLAGNDRFTNAYGEGLSHLTRDAVAIRFHMHPDVQLDAAGGSRTINVRLRSGEDWQFWCESIVPEIEESIYFCVSTGHRKSMQIVLNAHAEQSAEVNWHFVKIS